MISIWQDDGEKEVCIVLERRRGWQPRLGKTELRFKLTSNNMFEFTVKYLLTDRKGM